MLYGKQVNRRNRRTKNSISVKVGERLAQIRKMLNYTSRQMATRLGITDSGYSRNESGENLPGISSLRVLQKEYDISIDWLFFNKGPMHYKSKHKASTLDNESARLKEEAQRLKKLEQRLHLMEERLKMEAKERAEEEEERLKLEKEALKNQKKGARDFVRLEKAMPDITELLEYMEADPQFRHKLFLDFYSYKKEKADN